MSIISLIESIAADLNATNVQSYINLLQEIVNVAEKIEAALPIPSSANQTPPQNGSAS